MYARRQTKRNNGKDKPDDHKRIFGAVSAVLQPFGTIASSSNFAPSRLVFFVFVLFVVVFGEIAAALRRRPG